MNMIEFLCCIILLSSATIYAFSPVSIDELCADQWEFFSEGLVLSDGVDKTFEIVTDKNFTKNISIVSLENEFFLDESLEITNKDSEKYWRVVIWQDFPIISEQEDRFIIYRKGRL